MSLTRKGRKMSVSNYRRHFYTIWGQTGTFSNNFRSFAPKQPYCMYNSLPSTFRFVWLGCLVWFGFAKYSKPLKRTFCRKFPKLANMANYFSPYLRHLPALFASFCFVWSRFVWSGLAWLRFVSQSTVRLLNKIPNYIVPRYPAAGRFFHKTS